MLFPYRRLITELSVMFKPAEEKSPPSVEALSDPKMLWLAGPKQCLCFDDVSKPEFGQHKKSRFCFYLAKYTVSAEREL